MATRKKATPTKSAGKKKGQVNPPEKEVIDNARLEKLEPGYYHNRYLGVDVFKAGAKESDTFWLIVAQHPRWGVVVRASSMRDARSFIRALVANSMLTRLVG